MAEIRIGEGTKCMPDDAVQIFMKNRVCWDGKRCEVIAGLIEHCEAEKLPYSLRAFPGDGYELVLLFPTSKGE